MSGNDRAHPGRGGSDVLERNSPPFDLSSDMLFALALCRTAPLRSAHPGVPFLSIAGRTPLLLWFSRVREACYWGEDGQRRCDGGVEAELYHELNVAALLRRRAIFVPGIWATSERSVRIGQTYGMPKHLAGMTLQVRNGRFFESRLEDGQKAAVRARIFRRPIPLVGRLGRVWPRQVWPALFPGGGQVRAIITASPAAQLALVRHGRLALRTDWLPAPARLLPLGIYMPGLRMRLPPP